MVYELINMYKNYIIHIQRLYEFIGHMASFLYELHIL